jgi:hypothetical protein
MYLFLSLLRQHKLPTKNKKKENKKGAPKCVISVSYLMV